MKLFGGGYGWLGLVGPKYVDPLVDTRVIRHEWDCDHSQYYREANLTKLMRLIIQMQLIIERQLKYFFSI